VAIIEVQNLKVVKKSDVICSVRELAVETSERMAVVGPNGSGKSTLLRVLAGLERDFQGSCSVGVERKQRVYVHQTPYLFRGTVLFNVKYGLRSHGIRGTVCEQRARHWLERTGIAHLADSRAGRLSGGERKRTALARALAVDPRVLLLDEPFAELDENGAADIVRILTELQETTVVLVSPTPLRKGLNMRQFHLS